jgi:hypothetical protein
MGEWLLDVQKLLLTLDGRIIHILLSEEKANLENKRAKVSETERG